LTELEDFVHPSARQMDREVSGDRAGHVEKGQGESGHGSTQLEPRTTLREKAHEQFARELASHIDAALMQHQCKSWVLIASNPFLGALKAQLSQHAKKAMRSSVPSDLTSYSGPDLMRRVNEALSLPAGVPLSK
jgi:protein required for attachment to host cells